MVLQQRQLSHHIRKPSGFLSSTRSSESMQLAIEPCGSWVLPFTQSKVQWALCVWAAASVESTHCWSFSAAVCIQKTSVCQWAHAIQACDVQGSTVCQLALQAMKYDYCFHSMPLKDSSFIWLEWVSDITLLKILQVILIFIQCCSKGCWEPSLPGCTRHIDNHAFDFSFTP